MASYTDGNIVYEVSLDTKNLLENSGKVREQLLKLSSNGEEAAKGLNKVDKSAQGASNSLGKLSTIAKAVSAALVSSQIIAYAQSWNELEDRIGNTGATASQTKDIMDRLLETSNRNGRTIEESSELYIRLSNSMKELGFSANQSLTYIDSMSDLFTINKTSIMGAEAAINALTKAQMKGKLSGVEAMTVFNSMPSVLGTLVNYFKKTAKSSADADKITEQYVRTLANDGKLSMETFTSALIGSNDELAKLADNMRNNVNDGITRVTNNLKKYLGEMNNATGGTKLLVDSLILMSEHVDLLVTSVGVLAAIYAGKYVTSLATATKQSVEKTLADSRQAVATKALEQAEINKIKTELSALNVQKQNIIMAQAHSNSLRAQTALTAQLTAVEAKITAAQNAHTAAQVRLSAAMRASSLVARGLSGAMNMLGGPAGILLIAAGALMAWGNSAEQAQQKALGLGDYVKDLTAKFAGLNKEQKELEISRLKVLIDNQKKAIKDNAVTVALAAQEYKKWSGEAGFWQSKMRVSQEDLNRESNKYKEILSTQNKLIEDNAQAIEALKKAEEGTLGATKKLTSTLEDQDGALSKSTIDNIAKSLSKLAQETEISSLKQSELNKEAYVYQNVLSTLGDEADKYQAALLKAAESGELFKGNIEGLSKEIYPLIEAWAKSYDIKEKDSKANKSKKKEYKDLTEEIKKLETDLSNLAKSYNNGSSESKIMSLEQETNTKITGKQREELTKLFNLMDGYSSLDSLKNPIDIENDSYDKATAALDDWYTKNKDKQKEYNQQSEKLEADHLIKLAQLKADQSVSPQAQAVAQVDPVQALMNENTQKLALIKQFEEQRFLTEQQSLALRNAANTEYEQKRTEAMWEIWRNQSEGNEFLASSLEGLASSATSTISGLASGTMNATEAMQNFANVILNQAVGSLVQMGLQQVQNAITAQTATSSATSAQLIEAGLLTEAYTAAAMQASIATMGAAASTGATAYTTAIGTMKAASIAGAREHGGTVDANSMYRVGEGGKPEILMSGGKQYLLPGEHGQVLSNRDIKGSSSSSTSLDWTFIVENNASNAEVQQPSIDQEKRIVRLAVSEVASGVREKRGDVWSALSTTTNVTSKLR